MSGGQDDPGPGRDDEVLRRRLAAGAATSPEHDRAVLEAAARATADIADRGDGAATPAGRGRRTGAPARWLLPLAAALVLAVTVPWLVQDPGPVEDAVRGAAAGVVPASGAVLSRPPEIIRGPQVPGAEGYRLVVRDSAARELWRRAPQATPEFGVTGDLRRALPAEGTVLWTLSAVTPTGSQEHGPYWFRLEP